MQFKPFSKVVLAVISIACVASADPYPDPGNIGSGGGGLIPVGPGQGGGGWVGGPGQGGPGWPTPPQQPPPPYYPPQPPPPQYPPQYPPQQPGYGTETRQIWIGRNVLNESFDLRSLGGIGYQYQGWEVVSVRANTRPNNPGRTVAQLVADGNVVATQINPGNQINMLPQYQLVLDQNVGDLRLAVSGGTFVDSIQVEIRQAGYNPPGPGYCDNIEIDVYRQVYGNDRLDLSPYLNSDNCRGRQVEQIIVTGASEYNASLVNVVINGISSGQMQFTGGYSQRQQVWLRQPVQIVGRDRVMLYTSGDMQVEHVTLVLR